MNSINRIFFSISINPIDIFVQLYIVAERINYWISRMTIDTMASRIPHDALVHIASFIDCIQSY